MEIFMAENKIGNNRALQALVNAGADAYKNMYDVRVVFPWDAANGDEQSTVLSVRASGFKVPDLETATAEIKYHGVSIKVPKPEQTFERAVTLTFRMDATYALYGNFCMWHETVSDMVSGGVANWAGAIGRLEVEAINGKYAATDVNEYTNESTYDLAPTTVNDKNVNPTWKFYDVWVSKVTDPEYSTEDSNALTYEVTFQFGDCDYPFYNKQGIAGTGDGGARKLGIEGQN